MPFFERVFWASDIGPFVDPQPIIRVSPFCGPVIFISCLLYTSDAADEEDSVDLGGRGIIKKKKND